MSACQHQEVAQALEQARAVPDFTFIPAGASEAVAEALRGHAHATGKEILEASAPSRGQALAAEHAARDVPTVKRGDDRAFLANLTGIASGAVKVK